MDLEQLKERSFLLQEFAVKLNNPPLQTELAKTPDGKAFHIPISILEMKLDEVFYGCWATHTFETKVVANEIVGSIVLEVVHPITLEKIQRTGSASIQIMVDALNDAQKMQMTQKEKNQHALNIDNKKPNALDLSYPKLKADCIKNACVSLGRYFGRDLNRKLQKDAFQRSVGKPKSLMPKISELPQPSQVELKKAVLLCEQIEIPLDLKTEFVRSLATNTTSDELVKKVLSYGR